MKKLSIEDVGNIQNDYSLDIYDYTKGGRANQSVVLDELSKLEVEEWLEVIETEWDLRTLIRIAIQNRFSPKKKFRVVNALKRSGEKCWLIQRFK